MQDRCGFGRRHRLAYGPFPVFLIERNDVIEHLSRQPAHPTLCHSVLARTSAARSDRLDSSENRGLRGLNFASRSDLGISSNWLRNTTRMSAPALSSVQWSSQRLGAVKLACWKMPVQLRRFVRPMPGISRGDRLAERRRRLPSCQFEGAHVDPRRAAPHHFAAQPVGVIAYRLAACFVAQQTANLARNCPRVPEWH